MKKHVHKAIPALSVTAGWSHCVAKNPCSCSGAAHGNVTCSDTCACGATRDSEWNGRHRQYGAWRD
jgi:hypothetical protein